MPAPTQPQQQAPMEAASPASGSSAATIVTQQPKSQPLPSLHGEQDDMSLRGGGMNIGCGPDSRLCGCISCRYTKSCC